MANRLLHNPMFNLQTVLKEQKNAKTALKEQKNAKATLKEQERVETALQGKEGSERKLIKWKEKFIEEDQQSLKKGDGGSSSSKTEINIYKKWWRFNLVN